MQLRMLLRPLVLPFMPVRLAAIQTRRNVEFAAKVQVSSRGLAVAKSRRFTA